MRLIKNILIASVLAVTGVSMAIPVVAQAAEQHVVTQPTATAEPGCIVFEVSGDKPVKFSIYSITGQVVKVVNASPGRTVVEMPRGYYIVKCEDRSTQVVVR